MNTVSKRTRIKPIMILLIKYFMRVRKKEEIVLVLDVELVTKVITYIQNLRIFILKIQKI